MNVLQRKNKEETISIWLLLLVLVAPAPGVLFGGISIRLIDLALLGISLLFFYYMIKNEQLQLSNWLTLFIRDYVVLFFVLACVSIVVSTIYGSIFFPKDTAITDMYEIYRYLFYFSFYCLALHTVTNLNHFFRIGLWVVFAIEVFGLMQFFNFIHINHHFGLLYTKTSELQMMIDKQQRITSTLGNPNVYGSFLIIVLIALFSVFLMKKKLSNNDVWMLYGLLLLTFFSIYMTTSRTTVIVAFGILVYMGLQQLVLRLSLVTHIIGKALVQLFVFVCIGILLVPQIHYLQSAVDSISKSWQTSENETNQVTNVNNETSQVKESLNSVSSFNSRQDFWQMNKDIFLESPILGAGPMKQGLAFADNAYLFILARYGLVGMAIYSLFLLYMYSSTLVTALKKEMEMDRRILATIINAIIVAYAVMGIVAESFFNIESMIVFFFLIGLLRSKRVEFRSF